MYEKFQELYEKYHEDLFSFLYYLVNNHELAQDLAQEVYIKVLKSYENFKGNSSERTWLFSIARNTAVDYFRKQAGWKKRIFSSFDWANQELVDPAPLPEEIAQKSEQAKSLYLCLEKCSIDQKMVLVLRYLQTMSISETASALGWSESKVKTTQHRALKKVKGLLEEISRREEHRYDQQKMFR